MMYRKSKAIIPLFVLLSFAATIAYGSGQGVKPANLSTKADAGDQSLWVYRQSVSLGVPEQELSSLMATCRDQGFTTSEMRRVLGLIAKAKLAGLPHGDLLAKLREGLAKRARPEMIFEALSVKAKTLRRSKGLVDNLILEGWASSDYQLSIKIVADALDFGVSPQNLLGIVRGDLAMPEGMPDVTRVFTLISGK